MRALPRPLVATALIAILAGALALANDALQPFVVVHTAAEFERGQKTQVEVDDAGLRLSTLPHDGRAQVPTEGRLLRIGFDDPTLPEGSYPVFEAIDAQVEPRVVGTFTNDAAVAGQVGGAIDLERDSAARIRLLRASTDLLAGAPALTFMAWVAPESLPGSNDPLHTLFSLGTSTASRVSMALGNDARLYVYVDGPYGAAAPVLRLQTGAWTHLAVVVELDPLNRISLYVNGVRTDSVQVSFTAAQFSPWSASQAYVGAARNGEATFDGRVDEVAFHRRALSAAEIRDVYARQRGTTTLTGRFESAPIDSMDPAAQWETLSWRTDAPVGQPLPAGGGSDVDAFARGGVDMVDNVLLLRFDPDGALFDGASLPDHSGRGHHATLFDGDGTARHVAGRFGQALELQGPDYLRIDDAASHVDFDVVDFTWSAWVKLPPCQGTGSNNDNMIVIGAEQQVRGSHLWMGRWCTQAESCSGRPAFVAYDSSNFGTTKICHHNRMDDGQWHHMVAVRGTSGITLYVDGDPVHVDIQYISPFNFDRPLHIGQWVTLANPTPVTLDELAIWRRALTEAEVRALYLRGAARVRVQARICPTAACDGVVFAGPDGRSQSAFTQPFDPEAGVHELPPASGRYAQYAVELERDPAAPSPMLIDVTVTGHRTPPTTADGGNAEGDGGAPTGGGGISNPDAGGVEGDGGTSEGARRSVHGWSCSAAGAPAAVWPLLLLVIGAAARLRRTLRPVLVLCGLLMLAGAARAAEADPYAAAVERLFKDFEYEEAIRAAQKALARPGNPPAVEVRVSLFEGISHAELGQTAQALRAFKRALSLDPSAQLPVAVSPRTEALFEQARTDMAVATPAARPEMTTEPDGPDALASVGTSVSLHASAFGFADVLGRSVGPGADVRLGFGGLQTRLLVFGGSSVGLALEAGYLFGDGALQPKVGLRGYYGPSTRAAGGGVLLGVQYAPWDSVSLFVDGSAELYAVEAPWRPMAVLVTSGVSWRFLSL